MLNHVVYLLRITNVNGNSVRNKLFMRIKKQNAPTNLDVSYAKNPFKTNQD